MRKLLLLILLLGSLYLFWDVYFASHTLPYQTGLTNKEGTTLEARITRADSKNVTFISLEDGREYTVPVNGLSLLSRYKVLRLINKEQPTENTEPTSPSAQQNYINNLQKLIDENNQKIATLRVQISQARLDHFSASGGISAKERSLQRQIERLIEENIRYSNRIMESNIRGN